MVFHSARACILRKKSGIYCGKSVCLKRQLVLSNLIRSNANKFACRCTPFIKRRNDHALNVIRMLIDMYIVVAIHQLG